MRQVAEINGIVADIAGGAESQSSGLGEINSAIGQMTHMTEQNVATAEDVTAASHALYEERAGVSNLVGQFVVGTNVTSDDLWEALKSAAPHAFRKAPRLPLADKAGPKPVFRCDTTAPKKLAKVSAARAVDNWEEF